MCTTTFLYTSRAIYTLRSFEIFRSKYSYKNLHSRKLTEVIETARNGEYDRENNMKTRGGPESDLCVRTETFDGRFQSKPVKN